VIAALDLEATSFVGCPVIIDEISFSMRHGKAELMGSPVPIRCKPGDQMTILYKLETDSDINSARSVEDLNYALEVRVTARAFVSSISTPEVQIKFRTNVDFAMALVRPTSSGLPNSRDVAVRPPHSQGSGPDTLAFATDRPNTRERHMSIDTGLRITIFGPKSVYVGGIFRWQLFVVNASKDTRQVAVVVIPKRRRSDGRTLVPQRYSIGSAKGDGAGAIAEAVVDENVLYGIQKNAMADPTELITLSTDVRIG